MNEARAGTHLDAAKPRPPKNASGSRDTDSKADPGALRATLLAMPGKNVPEGRRAAEVESREKTVERWSPTFLAAGTGFMKDNFSIDQGGRGSDGYWMIQAITFLMHFTSIIIT